MFGDGRWEDQAESETAGAWGVMQRKEEYGAGTQYLQACQELESMSSGGRSLEGERPFSIKLPAFSSNSLGGVRLQDVAESKELLKDSIVSC